MTISLSPSGLSTPQDRNLFCSCSQPYPSIGTIYSQNSVNTCCMKARSEPAAGRYGGGILGQTLSLASWLTDSNLHTVLGCPGLLGSHINNDSYPDRLRTHV